MDDLLKSKTALEILQALKLSQEGMRASKIADQIGRTRPTVSRTLTKMKKNSLVFQDGEKRTAPYKNDYEGLGSYWVEKLNQKWIERFEVREAEMGELTVHSHQIKRFGAKIFEEELSNDLKEENLYEFLFETPAINISLYLEMNEETPEYLRMTRRALLTFVGKQRYEEQYDSVVKELGFQE